MSCEYCVEPTGVIKHELINHLVFYHTWSYLLAKHMNCKGINLQKRPTNFHKFIVSHHTITCQHSELQLAIKVQVDGFS